MIAIQRQSNENWLDMSDVPPKLEKKLSDGFWDNLQTNYDGQRTKYNGEQTMDKTSWQ